MAPRVHGTGHLAAEDPPASCVVPSFSELAHFEDGYDDDVVLIKQEIGRVIVCGLDVAVQTPALFGTLAPEPTRSTPMCPLHLRQAHTLAPALCEQHLHWRDLTVGEAALQRVDAMAPKADLLVSVVQERAVFARRRRIPLLKRGTARIRRDDALAREVWVWVLPLLHSVEVDEVKGPCALVPLDLAVLPQTVSLGQHASYDARTVLHPDATHVLEVVAQEGLARSTPRPSVEALARLEAREGRCLLGRAILLDNYHLGGRLPGRSGAKVDVEAMGRLRLADGKIALVRVGELTNGVGDHVAIDCCFWSVGVWEFLHQLERPKLVAQDPVVRATQVQLYALVGPVIRVAAHVEAPHKLIALGGGGPHANLSRAKDEVYFRELLLSLLAIAFEWRLVVRRRLPFGRR